MNIDEARRLAEELTESFGDDDHGVQMLRWLVDEVERLLAIIRDIRNARVRELAGGGDKANCDPIIRVCDHALKVAGGNESVRDTATRLGLPSPCVADDDVDLETGKGGGEHE